jgi:hypothetical protein
VSVVDESGEAGFAARVAAQVAASAVSAKRTLLVEVNGFGYVSGVHLLSPVVRTWDSGSLNDRACQVAGVAHDRYTANMQHRMGGPAADDVLQAVADQERRLNF